MFQIHSPYQGGAMLVKIMYEILKSKCVFHVILAISKNDFRLQKSIKCVGDLIKFLAETLD